MHAVFLVVIDLKDLENKFKILAWQMNLRLVDTMSGLCEDINLEKSAPLEG